MSADGFVSGEGPDGEADLESALWDYAFHSDNARSRLALSSLEQAGADWKSAKDVVDMLSIARHWVRAELRHSADGLPLDQYIDSGLTPLEFPIDLGRYKLLREIGSGGNGIVYAGFDGLLHRHVAIKVPLMSHQLNEDSRQRFIREGRAAARLSHPNVVRLHEVAQAGNISFIVSDLYAGPDLATWLLNRQAWPTCQEAAAFIAALADGVAHAHEQGVLHRDIKPANILLTTAADGSQRNDQQLGTVQSVHDEVLGQPLSECRPILTDFGLAKLCETDEGITQSGIMMGTPAYMAPEQFSTSRQTVNQTADIYSLGAVLYELITGRALFTGPSVADVLRQVANDDPVRCRKYQPSCPPDLEAICIRCLSKRPDQRYASARQLADDLRRFLNGEPTLARPIGLMHTLVRWAYRHRNIAAMLLALLVTSTAFVIISAWYVYNLRRINGDLSTGLVRERELVQQVAQQESISRAEAQRNRQFAYAAAVRDGFRMYQTGDTVRLANLLKTHPLFRDTSPLRFEIGLLRSVSLGSCRTLDTKGPQISSIAIEPNGPRIFAGDYSGRVSVWNSESGELVQELAPIKSIVEWLALAPGGHDLIAVGKEPQGHWYSWSDRGELTWGTFQMMGRGSHARAAFSPSGKQFAVPSKQDSGVSVEFYTLPFEPGMRPVRAFSTDNVTHLHGLAWTRNEDRFALAAGYQEIPRDDIANRMVVWQTADWSQQMEFPLPPSRDYGSILAGPSGDNLVVCNGSDYVAVIDPISGGRIEGKVPNSRLRALSVDEQADCIHLSGPLSVNGVELNSVDCLDLDTLALRHRRLEPYATGGPRAFDSRGTRFTQADFVNRIRVRDLGARGGMWLVQSHKSEVWGLAWSPDGKMLASTSDEGSICLLDIQEMRVIRCLVGHDALVSCAVFSSDGATLYSGAYDGTVRSWDVATGTNRVLAKDQNIVRTIAIDRSGRWCAFAGNKNTCHVVDLASDDLAGDLPILGKWQLGDTVRGLAFSADGAKVVSIDENRKVEIHDWRSGDSLVDRTESHSLNSLAMSSNGQSIYLGDSSGLLQRVDAPFDNQSGFGIVGKHLDEVLSVSVSPDDRLIATGGLDSTVRIWDVATSTELACWSMPTRVNAVSWSPDGRRLAAALHDGSVIIWSTE